MDKRTAGQQPDQVAEGLALIKSKMVQTYAAIQARARTHGNRVFADVRAGLRGEPGRFYAIEAGHVVGTPFGVRVTADIAALMLEFGGQHVVMFALEADGVAEA